MPSQKQSNPTEVHISNGRQLVQRTLVLRNTSGKDFVLKLIGSHKAVTFPTNVFRFPPHSHRVVQFRIDAKTLGQWDKQRLAIKGFVLPVYAKSLKTFIDQKEKEGTAAQEAFSLAVKFSDGFSAPQTVVNLPGKASCIESTDHPVDVEELDTATAVNIDKDAVTAAPIGSMMGFVDEYKKKKAASGGCWLTNMVCGGGADNGEKEKSMRSRRSNRSAKSSQKSQKSQKSCKSEARKQGPNTCLEATPCGGSTVQA